MKKHIKLQMKKFRHWFFDLPFALRLNFSIIILLVIAISGIWIFISGHIRPYMERKIIDDANDTISDIISDVTSNVIRKTESGTKLVAHLLEREKDFSLSNFSYNTQTIIKTIDPENTLINGAFVYLFPNGKKPGSLNQIIKIKNQEQGPGIPIRFFTESTNSLELYQTREWFTETMKKQGQTWTEPYVADDEEGNPVLVTFALPFKHENGKDWKGITGITISLKGLQHYFENIAYNGNGKALLLSKKGLYISHPSPDVKMEKTIFDLAKETGIKELQTIGEEMAKGHNGMLYMKKSTVVQGSSVVSFYDVIPNTKWGVCLVFTIEAFFQDLRKFNFEILLAQLATITILIIFVTVLSRDLTKNLKKLSNVANEYGNGNFTARFPNLYGKDEIGTLANAFRNMKDNLIKYIEKEKKSYAFEQNMARDMEVARRIQNASMTAEFPKDPTFSVTAAMHPAKEVGGDFYDCFYLDKDKYAVLIADVSGKGIPAALFMMMSKVILNTIAESNISLEEVFNKVNEKLCVNNEAEMFVTVFMGSLNLKTGEMEYVNAGHNPPLLKTGGKYEFIKPLKNMVLGAYSGIRYKSGKLNLKQGDRLFLYTDGITEAQDKNGSFYGSARLKETLSKADDSMSPAETLAMLKKDIDNFAGEAQQTDDITMLELIYTGHNAADAGIEKKNLGNTSLSPAENNYQQEAKPLHKQPEFSDNVNINEKQNFNVMERRTFKAKIEEWDNVAEFIKTKSEDAGLPPAKQTKILISAEEIFSNIVHYAYEYPGQADIITEVKNGAFFISFEDTGIPYNPLEQADPDITLTAEERKIGGLGIFIVKKSMDTVEYERKDGKNIFTMGIRI